YCLERISPPSQPAFLGLQHALSDSAVGGGTALGFAPSRSHGEAVVGGLGTPLSTPHLFSGNLRGPGAVPRHLLPRCQLDSLRTDDGAGQRRSDESSQPLDQTGAGISVNSALSRVTAGDLDAAGSPASRGDSGRVGDVAGGRARSTGRGRISETESRDPHAELRDRALGESRSDPAEPAPIVVPCAQREDRGGSGTGRHSEPSDPGETGGKRDCEKAGYRPRA